MSSFSGLLNNAALMLVLCVIYDTFAISAMTNRYLRCLITGGMVGGIAIVVMLNPWSLQPGVFFDTRWVLLSLCGLFFELEATMLAVLIAGMFRLWQGGPGGVVGTIVIVVTSGVGVIWKYWRNSSSGLPRWKELYLFGVVVQLAMLACMALMPPEMRLPIIKAIAPPILAIFPVLTMVIGLILTRQEARRETERELEASRKMLSRERGLLRGVMGAIPDLIFFKDRDGNYLGCNTSFETYAGRVEADIIGRGDHALFADTSRALARSSERDAGQEVCDTKHVEEWGRYPDGRIVLFDTAIQPFYDLDGTQQGLVGISRDITERKRAEGRLVAERERLLVTLQSIGDGVITTNVRGEVRVINTVAEKLTGWTQDEAYGRPITEVFNICCEETGAPCENPVDEVIASGRIIGLANHTTLVARNGRQRSIADSAAPIRDGENTIIGAVLVFRDVTEQMRTDAELQKVKRLESIGILAGGIAHDFNNILTAILGNINLALLEPELPEGTGRLLAEAEQASIRARKLSRQLLTFSKGGSPVKEVSSLGDVIRDSADFVLHGDKVSCSYDIPDDLWLAQIDKAQIGQVIQNLVLNASLAMADGGRIVISCRNVVGEAHPHSAASQSESFSAAGGYVEITVEDTGEGIPPEIMDRIFDPYFSTREDGSGLGLSIAHSIVYSHGGSIAVDSAVGRGTRVRVRLPASTEGTPMASEPTTGTAATKKATVLVMDDEEMVQAVRTSMRHYFGHEVTVAGDGEAAVQLYRDRLEQGRVFDLVIMDLTIPGGMGGKEAVREVLRLDPEARVVVASGYSDDPILADCETYGFCAAIVKPFQTQDLASVLERYLR